MKVIPSLVAIILCTATTLAHSYYFEDSFEGGDMSSTNAEGFSWEGDNSNAIFNSQGMLWKKETGTNSPPLTSFSSSTGGWSWAKDSNSDWRPRIGSGSNYLNFIFNSADNWAERRFKLGTGLSDVWISYWLRVPTNYDIAEGSECAGSSAGDKFFALWQDGYSSAGDGSTIIWGHKPDGVDDVQVGVSYTPGCFRGINDKNAPAPCNGTPKPSSVNTRFINLPEDRGRWMHLILHARLSSTNGVADGLLETWRKWEGGTYTKLLEQKNVHLRKQGNGFRTGYILGDSGRGYCDQTEWLLDDMIFSSTPLMSGGEVKADPKAPTGIIVTTK